MSDCYLSDRYLLEQTHSQVSLAVRLIDDYTGGYPAGRVSVFIRDCSCNAVKTASGYHVFSNLPSGVYQVAVRADYYFDTETIVDTGVLDKRSPVANITLRPNPGYPFPDGATLLRGMVYDQTGQGIPGAGVSAEIMLPETAVKARVGNPAPDAGDTLIKLIGINGLLHSGDYLALKDSNRSHTEFCRIAAPLPENNSKPFELTKPLQFKHLLNTPLFLLIPDSTVKTETSSRGEYVVYFRTLKNDKFLTVLNLSCPGYQTEVREVEVCEGGLASLGKIVL
ncbi:carboxypeptidase-like regulatory domain-containing protein [Phosphitispora fastidiosa]|uniref:carboxypeptidase-like regulatory domain-containing protein n=1 Tax=Phosphitispora fastidiosa TaxID=2837202 RepID=UPI001E480BCF|nr:carboxypeptidase-like regulatory domain-containing protein [Phosphitispora fastidiosa]MBU7005782.1 hypothetical protein [Phosphitispora fastidiosa]